MEKWIKYLHHERKEGWMSHNNWQEWHWNSTYAFTSYVRGVLPDNGGQITRRRHYNICNVSFHVSCIAGRYHNISMGFLHWMIIRWQYSYCFYSRYQVRSEMSPTDTTTTWEAIGWASLRASAWGSPIRMGYSSVQSLEYIFCYELDSFDKLGNDKVNIERGTWNWYSI